MSVLEVIAAILLGVGALVMLAGAAGVLRFPDVYTRLHAAGKGDTLGQALILVGLMLVAGLTLVTVKLVFIVLLVLLLNPTATHALARSAWIVGIKPWVRPGADTELPPKPEGGSWKT
ncbi:MAG: monovalent cation/H(+) antiporter subunit G [Planctomycetota bacterium]